MTDEPEGPWVSEESACVFCGHEWVAVHPFASHLECPNCLHFTESTASINHTAWLELNK